MFGKDFLTDDDTIHEWYKQFIKGGVVWFADKDKQVIHVFADNFRIVKNQDFQVFN